MQRSFSYSSADQQRNHRSSTAAGRHFPIQLVYNKSNDYYSSDTDSQHQTYRQRTSSTSSFSSTSSTGSASYRILPVRYSSVDRILPKLPTVTANERGINVRIHFDSPHHHHKHHHYRHHQHKHNVEKSERHHHRHMTEEYQRYGSCPALDRNNRSSSLLGPSNITYIETRSIVRGSSQDQLNINNHSNSTISHAHSVPKAPITHTHIKHIPLNTNILSTRVIREEEE